MDAGRPAARAREERCEQGECQQAGQGGPRLGADAALLQVGQARFQAQLSAQPGNGVQGPQCGGSGRGGQVSYAIAAYAITVGTLVAYAWMLSRERARLDRD